MRPTLRLAVALAATAALAADAAAQLPIIPGTWTQVGGFRFRHTTATAAQNELYYGLSTNLGNTPRTEVSGSFPSTPFAFTLQFTAATNTLAFSAAGFNAGQVYTIGAVPSFNAFRVEANQSAAAGDVRVFDLALNGTTLPDVDPGAGANVDNRYGLLAPGQDFTLTGRIQFMTPFTNGEGQRAEFSVGNAQVVPEPSTYALMAAGLAGLVGAARRRRATA